MRYLSYLCTVLLLVFCIFACTDSKTQKHIEPIKLKLYVISQYGKVEKTITESPTIEIIKNTMNTLDWKKFHQVILEKENKDFIEVSGSLDPADGFSSLFQEGGKQYVIKIPPHSTLQMENILISYFYQDNKWKDDNSWE